MRRLWNRSNPALYSLSTISSDGIPNMNICTWVTKISFQPVYFLVSIDLHSKTYENIISSPRFLLQLLSKDAKRYVKKLGYTSGKNGNKLIGIPLKKYRELYVLPECLGFMELSVVDKISFGDHCQFICSLLSHKTLQDGEPLRLLDVL
ncbi:MAG: flavin reductase [Patescibacteria group bacterium]|nr:flavin reductase [Patescibacteria group bacterium]